MNFLQKICFIFIIMTLAVRLSATELKTFNSDLDSIAVLIKSGNSIQALHKLFPLTKVMSIPSEKARAKYLMGISFMEIGLNQTAAFQFVEVIRIGDVTWTKSAIEKLLVVTDKIGDETLLNYAIQRVNISHIPVVNREMLYYRLGEIKHKNGSQKEAIALYEKVTSKSRYYYNALYNMGQAQAEINLTDKAIESFQKLISSRDAAHVTDTNRVAAQMAIARTLYQKKDWSKSIDAYSKIPRDHVLWHEALFEKSWAMLRAGRFRSTLSNFHTLHSSFYEDFYLPESLLLRSIVYLYICQYDEIEKVLSLYEKQYNPALKKITKFLENKNSSLYYEEINKALKAKHIHASKNELTLPYNILKYISEEGNVRRTYSYLKKIISEKERIERNIQFSNSDVGTYARRIISNRIGGASVGLAEQVKAHLNAIKSELIDLNEQASFIRYEMINGQKEKIKKRIVGKDLIELSTDLQDRSFYVQNGYEFYPFQGEYWLDEIGNYHYSGKQSCEK